MWDGDPVRFLGWMKRKSLNSGVHRISQSWDLRVHAVRSLGVVGWPGWGSSSGDSALAVSPHPHTRCSGRKVEKETLIPEELGHL